VIASLEGILIESAPLVALVNVGGIGYEVHMPLTPAEKMPAPGSPVTLFTHAVYREDSQALYGFAARAERDFFRVLVEKVSGVGPRLALSILSRLSVSVLQDAIQRGDVSLLAQCKGVGKKTAERLVVDLRDTLGSGPSASAAVAGTAPAPAGGNVHADAVAALCALGYKAPEADKAVRQAAQALGVDASTEALIKRALG
jgi:Holliday junction DNA helicase RuvA